MGIKGFEPVVSAALPDVVALVPKEPAARLGRWEPKEGHRQRGTRVQTALNESGDLLSERLLGALELAVDRLAVDIPHDLVSGLTPSGVTRFGMVGFVREATATKEPVAILETLHPGATDLVVDLVEALRDKAAVLDATGDEAEIAARHGAAHLALAVIVSTAVLRSLGTAETPAIIGVALGAAALVLPTAPKPLAYAVATLAKRRVEYQLPRSSTQSVAVTDHRFWITEGGAVLSGDTSKPRRWESPLWPGEYRIRVHVTGRDDAEDSYDVVVWQAPAAPEVVHKKTDRLGHRLRGELEPPLVIPPHAGHHHRRTRETVVRGRSAR